MRMRTLLIASLFTISAQAFAHEIYFGGTFSGSQVNAPTSSAGTGTAFITFDLDENMMTVDLAFSGLTGLSSNSGLHLGTTAGQNGPLSTSLFSTTGFPVGVTSGVYNHTFDMDDAATYDPTFFAASGSNVSTAFFNLTSGMISDTGYIDITTSSSPNGEIRANLTAVPEPGTMTLLCIGLASLVNKRRKNRV